MIHTIPLEVDQRFFDKVFKDASPDEAADVLVACLTAYMDICETKEKELRFQALIKALGNADSANLDDLDAVLPKARKVSDEGIRKIREEWKKRPKPRHTA